MRKYFSRFSKLAFIIVFGLAVPHIANASSAVDPVDQGAKPNLVKINLTSADSIALLKDNSSPLEVFEPYMAKEPVNMGVIEALLPNAAYLVKFHMRNASLERLQACESLLRGALNLEVFSTLTYGNNDMDASCYELVAGLIPGWLKLRALNFTSSNFGNAAADTVLPLLYGSKTLEVLALPFDRWSKDCALSCLSRHHFEKLLKTCPRLMAFNIAGTAFVRGVHYENPNQVDPEDETCTVYLKSGGRIIESKPGYGQCKVLENVTASDMLARSWFKETFPSRMRGFDGWYDGLCYVTPLGYNLPSLQVEGILPPSSQNAKLAKSGAIQIRGAFEKANAELPNSGDAINSHIRTVTEIWVNN